MTISNSRPYFAGRTAVRPTAPKYAVLLCRWALWAALLGAQQLFAQNDPGAVRATGTVYDEAGAPFSNVTVTNMRSGKTTMTDKQGSFQLATLSGDSLVFTAVGYATSTHLSAAGQMRIALEPEAAANLEDVVVVGYGTARKQNLTTAISSIKGDVLNDRPSTTNLVQGLAGRVAGVNVMTNSGKPGGAPTIKIRGIGSINSSTAPLYVIDGIVGADPTTIDPGIVASVDVLKDASASAIYGSRGANGVVVITTRRGARNTSQILFNNTVSVSTLQHEVDVLNADEAAEMFEREYAYVPGRLAPQLDPAVNFPRKAELFNEDGSPKYHTDWLRETTRHAIGHTHSVSFTGGKDNFNAIANVTVRDNEGLLLNTYQKQINGFLKLSWDVKPWLSIQTSLNAGADQANNVDAPQIYPLGLNPVREMYEFLPFLPVKYADGTYSRKADFPGAEESENPVRLMNEIKYVTGRSYALANVIGTFHLVPHFDLTTSFSGQSIAPYSYYYAGTGLKSVSELQNGIAERTETHTAAWTNEEYLSYQNSFGKSNLSVIAGASWYYNVSSVTFAGAQNFFDNSFTYNSLQAGSVSEPPTSSYTKNQFNSYYARVNYAFDERYLLGASYRVDGSSRFGTNNKYGKFPSFSAGWNIGKEKFFDPLSRTINNLKLRGSYGQVGNAEIGNYVTLARLVNGQTIFNRVRASDVVLGSVANNDLKWEKSEQVDLGLDVDLLNSRVQLTLDVYNKVTKDLLYFKALPATSGFSGAFDNIGSIRNRGFEIGINSANIVSKNFTWNTSLNYSQNRSKVINLNGDIIYTWGGRIIEGGPLNEFFGYVRLPVWTSKQATEAAAFGQKPGDKRYKDVNGDGAITADDRTSLGNAMPKFEANMANTFTFKNISLYIDLEGMYGLHLINTTKHLMFNPAPRVNSYKDILGGWTASNEDTYVPALRLPSDANSTSEVGDSYFVEDASFLRVRNIALSYKMKGAWMERGPVKGMTVGVNVENAFLFTKYSGYDPEFTSLDGSLQQGVDIYQYPKPRTYTLSLNLNF